MIVNYQDDTLSVEWRRAASLNLLLSLKMSRSLDRSYFNLFICVDCRGGRKREREVENRRERVREGGANRVTEQCYVC